MVAYPTESVWGLGCDPFNSQAVFKLLALKSRPVEKGLILLASCWSDLAFLLDDLPQADQQSLRETWPGPVTWLVPHRDLVPAWITGDSNCVAVRVSGHSASSELARAFGGPIVSTSANPQGLEPAKSALKVRSYFGNRIDALVNGALGGNAKPTEIRDLASKRIIRAS